MGGNGRLTEQPFSGYPMAPWQFWVRASAQSTGCANCDGAQGRLLPRTPRRPRMTGGRLGAGATAEGGLRHQRRHIHGNGNVPARRGQTRLMWGMMLRRLFAAVLAAGLLLLIGAPAYAAPPVTETTTAKNVVDTFVDVGPGCESDEFVHGDHDDQPDRARDRVRRRPHPRHLHPDRHVCRRAAWRIRVCRRSPDTSRSGAASTTTAKR